MLHKSRRWGVILVLLWLAAAAQAQNMPDFVLRAAQAINARYGQKIDVNNVFWDYRSYSRATYDPVDYCPNIEADRPAMSDAVKNFHVVIFKIIKDGLPTNEIWNYLVYDDFSYLGPCLLPPPPTPIPQVFPTGIPPTASSCYGLTPRLAIGQQGRVTPGDPNNIREDHGVSTKFLGEIPGGSVFDVLDGPRCTGDGTWWFVSYNGIQGWTLEGKEGTYFTELASFALATPTAAAVVPTVFVTQPPTATPAPVLPTATLAPLICNPTIPPRLHIGEQARVTAGGIPNNMRQQQGRSSQFVGEIPPLGVFTVLEGPACTGDGAWWKVDYNGVQGWTLEGMEAEYWVEPILPNLQPITLANLSQIRPLPNWSYTFDGEGINQLRALTNDGTLFGYGGMFSDHPMKRWTPVDSYAAAETLNWTVTSTDAPQWRVGTNEDTKQWEFYGADGAFIGVPMPTPLDFNGFGTGTTVGERWAILTGGLETFIVSLGPVDDEANRVKTLPDAHQESIIASGFSGDSSTLVTVSAHKIYAWDTATWTPRLVHTLSASDRVIEWSLDLALSVSQTGQFMFMAPSFDPIVFVAPLQENSQVTWMSLVGVKQLVTSAFVRDEWILAAGTDINNNYLLMALPRYTLVPVFIDIGTVASVGTVGTLVVNPNGTLIAAYDPSIGIRVFGVWPQG